MDTSFWDDDEERLHIVYEDDQILPPVRTSTDNPGLAATAGQCAVFRTLETCHLRCSSHRHFCAGRKFDLRERFAEADLEGGPFYPTSIDVSGGHIHPKS